MVKSMTCPECGASEKMLILRYDGSYYCQRCGAEFRVKPKISVREEKEAVYLPERLRGFIDLLRPLTLIGSGVAGFFLVLLGSVLSGEPFSWPLAIGVGLILSAMQGAGQSWGQGEEPELDRANNKVYRPVPRGIVLPSEARLFALALITGAVGFSFAISFWFGLLSIIISFFAVFYTSPPIRMKHQFLASDFWQATSRGFLPFMIVYALFPTSSWIPLMLGVFMTLLISGTQATKDFSDMKGDEEFGVPTLPVKLGVDGARKMMVMLATGAFAFLGLWIANGFLPLSLAWLFVLLVPTLVILYSVKNPKTYRLAENSLEWVGYYAILSFGYILPPLLLV